MHDKADNVGMVGSNQWNQNKSDGMPGRQILDVIRDTIPFAQGMVVSVFPHGRLQIVQPARCPESLLRAYSRDFQQHDRASWQAILRNQAVRATDVWTAGGYEASGFFQQFLHVHGLKYVAAAPLREPIFEGYPGSVLLCRGSNDPNFTDAEIAQLNQIVPKLELPAPTAHGREAQISPDEESWGHKATNRVFVFDAEARLRYPAGMTLDELLAQQLREHARRAIEHIRNGVRDDNDRLSLPNSRGDLWIFHVAAYEKYPAIGDNAYIAYCLQPESYEWIAVRPIDVQADPELVRLLPALKFMQTDFHRNPTLDEIAKKAHLSPFHFHRRFTDVIGQTPKHFLLGCQIHEAKRLLHARKRELSQIASDCGFAHQSHFTSRFKQATGLTPTRWRRLAAQIVRTPSSN